MIEGSFDARTLAYMNVALDRVCEHTPLGEQHDVRERVAQGIVRCAKSGRTTLGALIEAGERALVRIPERGGTILVGVSRTAILSRPAPFYFSVSD
jgi:hypothetical protein